MKTQATRTDLLLAFALTLVGGMLRFHNLGDQSIWNDEYFSLRAAILPISEVTHRLNGVHPPLFFFLLHYITAWFGTGEWQLRLISAITGTLTIPAAVLLTGRLFNRRAAMVCGLLLALSPFHIAYSQEARPYALAGLFCVLSIAGFIALLERQTSKNVLFFALPTIGLLYSHHWGAFVLFAELMYVATRWKQIAGSWKYFVVSLEIIILAYLPELPALRMHTQSLGDAHWFWVEKPNGRELFHLAEAYAGGYFKMAANTVGGQGSIAMLGGIGIIVIGIIAVVAAVIGRPQNTVRPLPVLASIFIIGLAAPYLISFFRPELFLWYRYPVIYFPLFCIMAGGAASISIRQSQSTSDAMLPVIIVLLVGCASLGSYYGWEKSNVKKAAACVDSLTATGIPVFIRPNYEAPLINYYYKGGAQQYDETYLNGPLGAVVDTAQSFVFLSVDAEDEIRDYLDAHFQRTVERVFPAEAHMGLRVGEYRRKLMPAEGGDGQ